MPVSFASSCEYIRTHRVTSVLIALCTVTTLFPLWLSFSGYPQIHRFSAFQHALAEYLAAPIRMFSGPTLPPWLLIIGIHVVFFTVIWFFFGRDGRGRGTITPNEALLEDVAPYEAGALLAQRPTYASFVGMILDLVHRNVLVLERFEGGGYLSFTLTRSPGTQSAYGLEGGVIKRLFTLSLSPGSDDGRLTQCSFRKGSSEVVNAFRFYETEMYKRLTERGWYADNILMVQLLGLGILMGWTAGLVLLLESHLVDPHLDWVYFQIPLLLPFLYIMPRVTKEGAITRERVEGLAWYIRVAEKERLSFHHKPQQLFTKPEALLPYAIAMGINNEWTRHFLAGYEKATKKKT